MGPPEVKSLKIGKISQNRPLKKIMKFYVNSKNSLGDYPLRQSFVSWWALVNDTLRIKIGILV